MLLVFAEGEPIESQIALLIEFISLQVQQQ